MLVREPTKQPTPQATAPVVNVSPTPVTVMVDTAETTRLLAAQTVGMKQQSEQMSKALATLAEALVRLEPSKSLTVTVTEREYNGLIKTIKITKD